MLPGFYREFQERIHSSKPRATGMIDMELTASEAEGSRRLWIKVPTHFTFKISAITICVHYY